MANASAAYAFLTASKQVVISREKRMVSEGLEVEIESRRTHDLAGYPVLSTTHTIIDSEGVSTHIHRVTGTCGSYYVELVSTRYSLRWEQTKVFLMKIRDQLHGKFPG